MSMRAGQREAMEAMRRFRIGEQVVEDGSPELGPALRNAYEQRVRPICLCCAPGVAMYIARMGDQFLVKRMPLTGSSHNPSCESFEPPYELSGLGPLMGSAIKLDPASGMAELKLDFSLSKLGTRAAPAETGSGSDTVAGDARRLSLRSLLHFLWSEGGLTMWRSNWAGKRQWWNIRWHLIEAARQMHVRSGPLSDVLFVPEQFRSADKAAIEHRRAIAMETARPPRTGSRRLMILVGEVKEMAPARSGHKLIIKHMPGFVFLLDEGLHRRLQARYANELALWESEDKSHLVAIATFSLNPAGLAVVEEMGLMVVSDNWIPYESVHEKTLVDALSRLREPSVKGLRYNLPADQPIANALLQHRARPVGLYIVPFNADASFEAELGELIASRPEMESWVWKTGDGPMPALPVS